MKKAVFLKRLFALAALVFVVFSADPGKYLDWYRAADGERSLRETALAGSGSVAGALAGNYEILASPDGGVGPRLVAAIRGAKDRVWTAVYILSDKDVVSALKDAAARGVDVRLVLEGNVVGQPTINRKPAAALAKAGAKIAWSDASRFTYTHAKYLLADGAWWVGTGNFSHSTFTRNREFFVTSSETGALAALESTFLADFSHLPS